MYAVTPLPDNPQDLKRALEEELNQISGVLQAIATGQAYPHSMAQDRQQFWDDEVKSFNAARVAGANTPTWATIRNGINGYQFSNTVMNEVWPAPFHITHVYKPNSKIYPHIHWLTTGTSTGVVRWGIEYTFAKGHQQGADSVFPASSTIYIEQAATGTPYEHMICEATDDQALNSPNLEVDSLILTRVFRDAAHPNDTCTGNVFGLMADLHFQKAFWATKNKSPNFYK